jgi:hypothetical protein
MAEASDPSNPPSFHEIRFVVFLGIRGCCFSASFEDECGVVAVTPETINIISSDVTAIDCWWPNHNSGAWYGLRLNSRRSVLLSTGSRNSEESHLRKRAMPSVSKSRCWKHHPLWLLQNHFGNAASISVPNVWQGVQFMGQLPIFRAFLSPSCLFI